MKATALRNRCRRRGLSMTEMVITIAITTVAMVGAVQIMSLANRQGKVVENRRLAYLEAGNIMEQLMARPWADVPPGDVSAIALSEACQKLLPDAGLHVRIAAEDADPLARRITVEIDWQVDAQRRGTPVRLVAWRYSHQEVQP